VFAFAIESAEAAEKLARSPWFTQSLARVYARKLGEENAGRPWAVRVATSTEAALYRSQLAEFAEEVTQLLVVPVYVP
jgi:hypothetical protein